MGRQVLLAVAGGEGAFDDTVAWAMRCVVQPQDSLHIASVIRGPPGDMSFTRAFGDYSAIAAGAWQLEREAQEAAARNTLDQVLQIVRDVGVNANKCLLPTPCGSLALVLRCYPGIRTNQCRPRPPRTVAISPQTVACDAWSGHRQAA